MPSSNSTSGAKRPTSKKSAGATPAKKRATTAKSAAPKRKRSSQKRYAIDRIKGFLRGNPLAAIIILALILLIIVGTSVFMVTRSISDTPIAPIDNTSYSDGVDVLKDSENYKSLRQLQNDLKAVFYEHGITKDMVARRAVRIDATMVHYLNIAVPQAKADELRTALLDMLKDNNLDRLYSDDNNHIVSQGRDLNDKNYNFRLEIFLEPVAGSTPAVDTTPNTGTGQGATTVSPNTTPDPSVELDKFGLVPPVNGRGSIALLIDDGGNNYGLAERLVAIPAPATIAIIPYLQYSRDTAKLFSSSGKFVFLHYPMEPLSYPQTDPGEGAVLMEMPELLINEVSKRNVENLGEIDGVNNHMGSAVTESAAKMQQVLKSLAPYTKTFVDSNTSAKSVAYSECQKAGFKCGINKKFLDNSNDQAYIAGKLYEAAEAVQQGGTIIVIGHLRPDTIDVLEYLVPRLQKSGYKFVSVPSAVN